MIDTLHKDDDVAIKSWQKVETAYFQRIELLEPYIQQARRQGGNSAELIALSESYIAAKNSAPCYSANPSEIKTFRDKQETLTAALAKLVVSQDIYPKLMADPSFRIMHSRIDEIESQISKSTEAYHRTIHELALKEQRLSYKIAGILNLRTEPCAPEGNVNVSIVLNTALKNAPAVKATSPNIAVATN
jgi:hypothetical protein